MAQSILSDQTITLTRGDTFRAKVEITDSRGEQYEPQQGDVIRFAMKKYWTAPDILIEKAIPNDTLILQIDPEDTKDLKFGKYVYDIQITKADGDVDTFIAKKHSSLRRRLTDGRRKQSFRAVF